MKEITTKKRDTIESKLPSSRSNKTKILKKKKEKRKKKQKKKKNRIKENYRVVKVKKKKY